MVHICLPTQNITSYIIYSRPNYCGAAINNVSRAQRRRLFVVSTPAGLSVLRSGWLVAHRQEKKPPQQRTHNDTTVIVFSLRGLQDQRTRPKPANSEQTSTEAWLGSVRWRRSHHYPTRMRRRPSGSCTETGSNIQPVAPDPSRPQVPGNAISWDGALSATRLRLLRTRRPGAVCVTRARGLSTPEPPSRRSQHCSG